MKRKSGSTSTGRAAQLGTDYSNLIKMEFKRIGITGFEILRDYIRLKEEKMKRFISVLLVVTILFITLTVPAMAETIDATEEFIIFSEETLENRIAQDINFFSDVISQYGDVSSLKISDSYIVQDTENDTFITFIFDDKSCIGFLTITYQNGEYYSSISFDDLSTIDNYLALGIPFYVSCTQAENDSFETLDFVPVDILHTGQALVLQDFPINNVAISADYTSYNIERDVIRVANSTVDGVGICWAACVAALSNYRKGTSYTARQIYDAMDEAYLGTPAGNTTWYNRAFTYVGLHCSSIADGVSYLTVYNQLYNNNNPQIFSVYSSEDDVSHAIVCKAVKGYSTGIKFGFMDPNYSSTTYTGILTSPSDPSKFSYTTSSGRVYDVWKYYRYSIV